MIKIAITGPESTGKTALAKKLATHFNAPWEPELSREYVENLTHPYTYEDVCEIAKLQIEQELKYERNEDSEKIVFFDTDLITTKVWLEYKYRHVPDFVKDRIKKCFFDFYLLCDTDIAWQPDPVREHGDDRDFFFQWYKKEIETLRTPYAIINGQGEKRNENALKEIYKLIRKE